MDIGINISIYRTPKHTLNICRQMNMGIRQRIHIQIANSMQTNRKKTLRTNKHDIIGKKNSNKYKNKHRKTDTLRQKSRET